MNTKAITLFVTLIGCLVSIPGWTSQSETKEEPMTLTFGIVPQQAASKLLASWQPTLKWLQKQTGYQFMFKTAPSIPVFEDRVSSGEYDFSYMNPYHFTIFNKGDEGYQAVAKASDKRIRGIIVVQKHSSIKSLEDLHGKSLAFPAPAAFAASVLPRAHLELNNINIEPRYVSSHDSVYRAVAGGFFPAGGGVIRTFNSIEPKLKEQLKVLWTSPGFTPHAIAAHSRLSAEVVGKVQQALAVMANDKEGRVALERLKLKGFEFASNSDWDDVRALQIDNSAETQNKDK